MKITEKNRSEMQTQQKYDAPAIEIVEVRPEKGFALTGPGGATDQGGPDGPTLS